MKGYIVKLYQKYHKFDQNYNDVDNFNVWFSFDYMRVITVDRFEDLYDSSISLNVEKIDPRDLNCYRQKLYLIGEDEGENIFSLGHSKAILSLSMLKFERDCTSDEQDAFLNNFFESKGIEYGLFHSISHSDKILVIRENSYGKIIDCLLELQCEAEKGKRIIKRIYTISCLNISKKNVLSGDDVIDARITVPLSEMRNLRIYRTDEIRLVMGKEDVELQYTGSSKEMVEYFIKKGVINDNGDILSMNRTTLSKSYDWNYINKKVSKGELPSYDWNPQVDDLKELLNKVNAMQYSSSIKNLLNRLIIRAWQLENSNGVVRNHEIWGKIQGFIQIVSRYSDDIYHNESTVEGIKALSLLMDNMSSDNYDDFEIPQGNARFTGTMSRLLQSYNGMLKKLSELTKQLRGAARGPLDYYAWAVIDTNEVVSVRQLFEDPNSEERLLIVNLSHSAMFHIREIMAWSIHEIGHYLRTNWSRKQRNSNLRENMKIAFLFVYQRNLGRAVCSQENQELSEYFQYNTMCNVNICEKASECDQKTCEYKHMDDQIAKLEMYYNNALRALFHGEIYTYFDLSYDQHPKMRGEVKEFLKALKVAYKEAQADMYMVSVLSIEDERGYIEVIRRYMEYSNMSQKEVSSEVIIRVQAVCIVINSQKKRMLVEEYTVKMLEDLLVRMSENEHLEFIDSLKDWGYFAFSKKLAEFLEIVYNSIEEALKKEECKTIKDQIKSAYDALDPKNNQGDSFEKALQFINEYESVASDLHETTVQKMKGY